MVIKTKAKDWVQTEKVSDETSHLDDPVLWRLVIDINIPSNLLSTSREVDVIDLSHQHSMTTIEDTEDEWKEDEFEEDVQSESIEESPKLLD